MLNSLAGIQDYKLRFRFLLHSYPRATNYQSQVEIDGRQSKYFHKNKAIIWFIRPWKRFDWRQRKLYGNVKLYDCACVIDNECKLWGWNQALYLMLQLIDGFWNSKILSCHAQRKRTLSTPRSCSNELFSHCIMG